MEWHKGHYLTDAAQVSDPRVSPLLDDDIAAAPPAYVVTGGFDLLRDEDEAYAQKLAAAGVPTSLRRHEALAHGVLNGTGVGGGARDALLEAAGAVRMGLAMGARASRGAPHGPSPGAIRDVAPGAGASGGGGASR